MEPFRFHLFVCTQQKPEGVTSCPVNGSITVLKELDREIQACGFGDDVQLTTCGCMGLCDEGPGMIVYPEGVWYRRVQTSDKPEIVGQRLLYGKPVDQLIWNDASAMKAMSIEHGEHFRQAMTAREKAGTLPDRLNEAEFVGWKDGTLHTKFLKTQFTCPAICVFLARVQNHVSLHEDGIRCEPPFAVPGWRRPMQCKQRPDPAQYGFLWKRQPTWDHRCSESSAESRNLALLRSESSPPADPTFRIAGRARASDPCHASAMIAEIPRLARRSPVRAGLSRWYHRRSQSSRRQSHRQ